MGKQDTLLRAADNAAATILAIYDWVDMVEKAGGLTSIAGVAKAHAMVKSLNAQRGRLDTLVLSPLRQAIDEAERND